mgnify:CR=1 FL=1
MPMDEEQERYLDAPSVSQDPVLDEIAQLLQMSVSALESKPQDVREMLRQLYLHSTVEPKELAQAMRDFLSDGTMPELLVQKGELPRKQKCQEAEPPEKKSGVFYLSSEQRRNLAKVMSGERKVQEQPVRTWDNENN